MNNLEEKGKEVLEHYGVKGMRWGVRKKRAPSSQSKEASALRKKRGFELTDDELKKVNARLNLEKQYRELSPSKGELAKGIAKKAAIGGTMTVLSGATAAGLTAVGKAVINYTKKKAGGG